MVRFGLKIVKFLMFRVLFNLKQHQTSITPALISIQTQALFSYSFGNKWQLFIIN